MSSLLHLDTHAMAIVSSAGNKKKQSFITPDSKTSFF